MVKLIDSTWLKGHLNESWSVIIDPRPPVNYLSGHIPRAVNIPISKILNAKTLRLNPEEDLSEAFGLAGIDSNTSVVVYDNYDGQNASLIAWTLEYLGQDNVRVLTDYMDEWASHGGEILYRPFKLEPRNFEARPRESVRISADELLKSNAIKRIDLRSQDEFYGKVATEVRSGRIPKAVNLPWTDLLAGKNKFLKSRQELEDATSLRGLRPTDEVVTYCSYGPRASIGYIALKELGYENVRVYDGSFHEWAQRGELPVEGEGLKIEL